MPPFDPASVLKKNAQKLSGNKVHQDRNVPQQ